MRINRVKLITEMARKEIKVAELAKKSGVSSVTITAIRSGKSCSRSSAYQIARALDIDIMDILEDDLHEQSTSI